MEIRKQPKLKAAFFENETTAREVSRDTGIPEAYISQAIHGRYVLDEDQKRRIAKSLNLNPEELFK